MPAKELHRLGLVARVTTPETLIPETLHWARELAARAPLALARAKLLFNGVAERTHKEAIEAENEALEASVRTEDHKGGSRRVSGAKATGVQGQIGRPSLP